MSQILSKSASLSGLVTDKAKLPSSSNRDSVLSSSLKAGHESVSAASQEFTMVKVRSNYARDRVVMLDNGKLVLHFDSEGLAYCPKHLLDALKYEMKFKPGRYVVEDIPAAATQVIDDELAAAVEELAADLAETANTLADLADEQDGALRELAEAAEPDPEPAPKVEAKPEPKRRGRPKKTDKKSKDKE